MQKACKAAASSLESGSSPLVAVQSAIAVMEDDPLANAGTGSNLTIDGHVECDASVMSDDGTFAAIAAAPGIQNPIAAATRLALDSREPLSHGRVRPLMLAGDAARKWAVKNGLDAAVTDDAAAKMHVTKKAKRQYEKYLEIINDDIKPGNTEENPKEQPEIKRQKIDNDSDHLYDTVGCCVVDCTGQIAAGVSSGGIALKTSGRVGEAALYGAGCWSEQFVHGDRRVGVSVTGVGERIMQHLIAREVGRQIGTNTQTESDITAVFEDIFNSTLGTGPAPRECGVLYTIASREDNNQQLEVQMAAVHCESKSMAIAWLWQDEHGKRRSESRILRRDEDGNAVQSLAIGVHWSIE